MRVQLGTGPVGHGRGGMPLAPAGHALGRESDAAEGLARGVLLAQREPLLSPSRVPVLPHTPCVHLCLSAVCLL